MGRLALVLALALVTVAPTVQAEEGRLTVPLVLTLLDVTAYPPEAALRESLLGSESPARSAPEWQFLPDGSARYGTAMFGVVVRSRCLYGAPRSRQGRGPR
ncbi:MAG: hypothetical protein ACE5JN_09445 [Candidatus Methylomirabilia bacterium]